MKRFSCYSCYTSKRTDHARHHCWGRRHLSIDEYMPNCSKGKQPDGNFVRNVVMFECWYIWNKSHY